MPKWLQDTKDGDKIALTLIFGGAMLVVCGSAATFMAIALMHEEVRIDRAIVALVGIGSLGGGLVNAGMGMLRFQQKAPSNGTATTTTATTVTSEGTTSDTSRSTDK